MTNNDFEQLKTDAEFKYLIGQQYEAELADKENRESHRRTAARLGDKYHVSSAAVQKYAKYSQALDAIIEKMPELVPKILSGDYKISHENILALADMGKEEIKTLSSKTGLGSVSRIRYVDSQRIFSNVQNTNAQMNVPSIKTIPAYNTYSLVNGLTLTIPSWAGSIGHIRANCDFYNVSREAKIKLEKALMHLQSEIHNLLTAMKEE